MCKEENMYGSHVKGKIIIKEIRTKKEINLITFQQLETNSSSFFPRLYYKNPFSPLFHPFSKINFLIFQKLRNHYFILFHFQQKVYKGYPVFYKRLFASYKSWLFIPLSPKAFPTYHYSTLTSTSNWFPIFFRYNVQHFPILSPYFPEK